MDSTEINYIHSQYPWASEVTADKLSKISADSTVTVAALASVLSKSAGDTYVQEIENVIKEVKKSAKTSKEAGENFYGAIKDSFSKSLGANDMSKVMDRLNDTSLKDATAELAGSINPVNRASRAMRSSVEKLGKVLGPASTALGVLAAGFRLAAGQQKELNSAINMGMTSTNLGSLTDLKRASLSGIGSFDEMMKIISGVMPTITNLAGDGLTGARQLAYFVAQAEKLNRTTGSGDWGLGIQEFAQALANEADVLYQLNEVESLDAVGKRRINNSFKNVMGIATFMSSAFGQERDSLLKEREANLTDVDFLYAYNKSSEYHTEQYGEAALENSREGYNVLISMMNSLGLPDDFVNNVSNTMNRARADLEFDSSVVNNATPEFLQQLNQLGLGPEFIDLMEGILVGQELTPPNVITELGSMFKNVHDNGIMLTGTDELSQSQREIMTSILNITDQRFDQMSNATQSYIDSLETKVEDTDDFIDAADGLKTLKGEFLSMATVSYNVSQIFGDIVEWIASIFVKTNKYSNMSVEQVGEAILGAPVTADGDTRFDEIRDIYDITKNTMTVTDPETNTEMLVRVLYVNGQITGIDNVTNPEYNNTIALAMEQLQSQQNEIGDFTREFQDTEQADTPEGEQYLRDLLQTRNRSVSLQRQLGQFQQQLLFKDVRLNGLQSIVDEMLAESDAGAVDIDNAYSEFVQLQIERATAQVDVNFSRDLSSEEYDEASTTLSRLEDELRVSYNNLIETIQSLGIEQELDNINGR